MTLPSLRRASQSSVVVVVRIWWMRSKAVVSSGIIRKISKSGRPTRFSCSSSDVDSLVWLECRHRRNSIDSFSGFIGNSLLIEFL